MMFPSPGTVIIRAFRHSATRL